MSNSSSQQDIQKAEAIIKVANLHLLRFNKSREGKIVTVAYL